METKDWTEWPDDFIPQVHQPHVGTSKDPTPWESRLKWVNSLDRRLPNENKGPFPNIKMDDFKKRLSSLREGIYKWGGQQISEIFVKMMCEKYPEAKQLCVQGKKISSISDFCKFVINGPWDDTMRTIVHYAQDGMWESDNKWSINLEKELTDMLAIRWSGKSVNQHFTCQRNTEGNCAHHLFVKKKNQVITRIRDTTRRHWKEAIYARQPIKKQAKKPSKIPKVMQYIKVDCTGRGFKGIIGYCEGHVELSETHTVLEAHSVLEVFGGASSNDDSTSDISSTPAPTNDARVLELERKLAIGMALIKKLQEENQSELQF